MIVDQKIIKEDGMVACVAEFKMGLMDLDGRALVAINEHWLQIINT